MVDRQGGSSSYGSTGAQTWTMGLGRNQSESDTVDFGAAGWAAPAGEEERTEHAAPTPARAKVQVHYGVNDTPPLYLSIILGLQVRIKKYTTNIFRKIQTIIARAFQRTLLLLGPIPCTF